MDHIEINPRVCNGKPVVRGTRIPVSVIVGLMAEGETWDQVLKGYPELTRDDLRAALQYASAAVEQTEISEASIG